MLHIQHIVRTWFSCRQHNIVHVLCIVLVKAHSVLLLFKLCARNTVNIVVHLVYMQLTLAKHKGEMMGIMLMESGHGSAIPSCVIAHMSKTGAAARSGLLNVGDHIISVNGVSLVGMPQKACIDQIKVGD